MPHAYAVSSPSGMGASSQNGAAAATIRNTPDSSRKKLYRLQVARDSKWRVNETGRKGQLTEMSTNTAKKATDEALLSPPPLPLMSLHVNKQMASFLGHGCCWFLRKRYSH